MRLPHKVAVVDCETTGFSTQDRIIEIAVVTFDQDFSSEERFSTLIQPDRHIPNSFVHGITAKDLDSAPTFGEVAGRIASLLDDHILVAHNAAFDTRMLMQEFSRLGHDLPKASSWSVDTMRLSQLHLPGSPSSLEDALVAVGITNRQAHSALADAEATAQLFRSLVEAGATFVARPVQMPSGALQHGTGPALPRPIATGQAETDAYQHVLIEALDDGVITDAERSHLEQKASSLGLSRDEAHRVHLEMLKRMAVQAWADGTVTADEQRSISAAADALKVDKQHVERLLTPPQPSVTLPPGGRIAFTGEFELPREEWEARARAAGFTVGGVVKKNCVLVAAVNESRSGKAKKARANGIPIISETDLAQLLSRLHQKATVEAVESTPDLEAANFPWFTDGQEDPRSVARSWIADKSSLKLSEMSPCLRSNLLPEGIDTSRTCVKRWLNLYPAPLDASVEDLKNIPGVGAKTLEEFVHAVVIAALDEEDDYLSSDTLYLEEAEAEVSEVDDAESVVSDADVLLSWLSITNQQLAPLVAEAPESVRLAARRLDAQAAGRLAQSVNQVISEFKSISAEDPRHADIVSERILASTPMSLEELGKRHSVTRERIRQLERPLRTRVRDALSFHIAALESQITEPVRPENLKAAHEYWGTPVLGQKTLLGAALTFSDSLVDRDGWVEPTTAVQELLEFAQAHQSPHGVLPLDELKEYGPSDDQTRLAWLRSAAPHWVILDGNVFTATRSTQDRAVAVLAVQQTPLTADELIDLIGKGSPRSLDNALSKDERVHRVGRGTWALVEWGGEEFTTLSDLIKSRLEATGSYPFDELAQECEELGVSVNSLRTYCSSGEFRIKNGNIVHNDETVEVTATPEESAGMYMRDGQWQFLVDLTHDHLRGSGSPVPRCLAAMFDIPFLGKRSFTSRLGEQVITFGRTNVTVGTIRRFLVDLGAVEGDRVWLSFAPDGTFNVSPATGRSQGLTGLDDVLNYAGMDDRGNSLATLNEAVGLKPDAPRRRLVATFNHRREEDIAETVRSL
ncbi:exonuclease domain-containing protein [Corynebacterium tapiri]|uniref:Exonuclease domain-containing protein n=1 Tax=Corynebacterium tapiri TaxID=1448266 RepID=A0A5C4U2T0_9CORY|nr:exonuclease domain-containing protein [Corynebacterium tapiri]TNL96798.1 hypothetical protein FHE74_07190 [Corynebacterium tapiri]